MSADVLGVDKFTENSLRRRRGPLTWREVEHLEIVTSCPFDDSLFMITTRDMRVWIGRGDTWKLLGTIQLEDWNK